MSVLGVVDSQESVRLDGVVMLMTYSTLEQFASAERFMRVLRKYTRKLPRQIILTLRGQALSGNVQAAEKGLKKALRDAGVIL